MQAKTAESELFHRDTDYQDTIQAHNEHSIDFIVCQKSTFCRIVEDVCRGGSLNSIRRFERIGVIPSSDWDSIVNVCNGHSDSVKFGGIDSSLSSQNWGRTHKAQNINYDLSGFNV